jgi:hypothetical protein
LPDSTGEFVHFQFHRGEVFTAAQENTSILDPITHAPSDQLFITYSGTTDLVDVQFRSDPNLLANPGPLQGPFDETGTPLPVQQIISTNVTDNFLVNSDAVEGGEVPEPGTLVLASLGIAGLFGHAWRKRKAAAG